LNASPAETGLANYAVGLIETAPEALAPLRPLLAVLVERVKSWGVSQEAAAERLSITRPRLNDLLRGKLGKFSLDALVNLTAAAGLILEFRIKEVA